MSKYNAVLLLGSNLGDRKKNILTARDEIRKNIGEILAETEIVETQPVEFCSSNNFYNFALLINTTLSPFHLLEAVKKIEKNMGRQKDSSAFGYFSDRIIDVDIVKYSNLFFKCRRLEIPHIRHLKERAFSRNLLESLEKSINHA